MISKQLPPSPAVGSSLTLDWLTLKLFHFTDEKAKSLIGGEWINSIPRWGYRYAWDHPSTGARILAVQPHSDAEPILMLSGQALIKLAHENGFTNTVQCSHLFSNVAVSATRVDIAVDIFDKGLSAFRLAESIEERGYRASSRKVTVYRSFGEKPGVTTYFGARTSPRMIRVYYKEAADTSEMNRTRVEIELKSTAAAMVWQEYFKSPPEPTMMDVKPIFSSVVETFNDVTIDRVMRSETKWTLPPRPDTTATHKDWLLRQVVPLLRRDHRSNTDNTSLLVWLNNEVTKNE